VDVVAQGDFLNEGTEVEIIEIHGNRVIVKAAIN
jgi:membrane-bound ClpP family serine protease